jgi:predicted ATPase
VPLNSSPRPPRLRRPGRDPARQARSHIGAVVHRGNRTTLASLLSIATDGRYPALALSAAQQRRLTLAALLDRLEALAREKPVLMLFEDVHWADATSLEALDLTVERIRVLPVLALFTFRPEYEAPWTGLSYVTSIALDRLVPVEVEFLDRAQLRRAHLLELIK